MMMKAFYKLSYRSGVSSSFDVDENIAPLHWGYVMKPHLSDIITLKTSQLHEAGIFARNWKSELLKDFETKPEEIGPQVLTLQHLAAGFVVIVCLLAFSVAIFAVEIAPKLSRNLFSWFGKGLVHKGRPRLGRGRRVQKLEQTSTRGWVRA
jgi:hypothetical protein